MSAEIYVSADQVVAAWPAFAQLPAAEQADLIAAGSAAVRAYVGRDLLDATRVEFHDGRNQSRIWLAVRPVRQVAEVLVNANPLDNADGLAWTFAPESGCLVRGPGLVDPRFAPWFPAGFRNVRVTYSAGYQDFELPAEVRRASILTIQALRAAAARSGAYRSESIGAYSYTVNDDELGRIVPPVARGLLSRYRTDELY